MVNSRLEGVIEISRLEDGTLLGRAKYFTVRARPSVPGAKMRVYDVISHSQQEALAIICWFGRWRQYVIEPRPGTVWSSDCLEAIQLFIQQLMSDWRSR